MSFEVDASGRMYVLDQINGRVVRFGKDGEIDREIPIDRANAQDISVAEDGSVAVLDRYGEKDVAIYDESGSFVGTLPLEGEGIEGAGHVTGVFTDGTDVYVEHEHGPLVKVGNTSGTAADPRETIPGRPSRDGTLYLKAGITDAAEGRTYVIANERPSGDHRFTRELRLGSEVRTIVLLDSDLLGTIYFAAEVAEGEDDTIVLLTCLDPQTGQPTGSATLPANAMPEETFRDFVVLDSGGVIYAHRTESGTTYDQYDCD